MEKRKEYIVNEKIYPILASRKKIWQYISVFRHLSSIPMSLPHSHQDSSPHSESIAHAFVRGLALGTGALVAVTAL